MSSAPELKWLNLESFRQGGAELKKILCVHYIIVLIEIAQVRAAA